VGYYSLRTALAGDIHHLLRDVESLTVRKVSFGNGKDPTGAAREVNETIDSISPKRLEI